MAAFLRCGSAVCLLLGAVAAQSPCPGGSPLAILLEGGRVGDGWACGLKGPIGAAGVLGVDVDPGPAATPWGTVCLGLGPRLALLPFVLDANGDAGWSGAVPATTDAVGIDLAFQAAADVGGTIVLSPDARARTRPPGVLLPGAGMLQLLDGLTNSVRWKLPAPGLQAATWLAGADRFAVVRTPGRLELVDGLTGVVTGEVSLKPPTAGGLVVGMRPAGNDRDVVLVRGPLAGTGPLSVRLVRLDGSTGPVVTTPPVTTPPEVRLVHASGSGLLWLFHGSRARAVDFETGVLVRDQLLGAEVLDARAHAGRVYALAGSSLWVFEADTGTPVPGLPLGMPVYWGPGEIAFGPPSFGSTPSVFVLFRGDPLTGLNPGLVELDTAVLAAQGFHALSYNPVTMLPGAGGWLVLERSLTTPPSGVVPSLRWFDPVTSATTVITPLPATTQPRFVDLRSDSIGRAWLAEDPDTLRTIETDPAGVAGAVTVRGVDVTRPTLVTNR